MPVTPVPGPDRRSRLPDPLPAGQLPSEDSRLWMFVPKSIPQGERWVQDDTRTWFEDHDRKVQIARHYPTHPRWIVGAAANTRRARQSNDGIVSEVHILARLGAGLPDMPHWVPAQLTLKQSQADLQYRLTKTARGVFVEKGKQAMLDFAERSPGQFLKFIASTFIPKQIEQNVTVTPGSTLDPEIADQLLAAFKDELKRRELLDAETAANPTDYPVADVTKTLELTAQEFARANNHAEAKQLLGPRPGSHTLLKGLRHVRNLEDEVVDIDPKTGEIEWD